MPGHADHGSFGAGGDTKRTGTCGDDIAPRSRDVSPAGAFADLYHGRWRIEEAFKRIKHRLRLEHPSGLSWHAARQDFGAKAVFDNLNALAAYVATNALLDPGSSYKIKRQIGRWLLAATATTRRLTPLLEEIALTLQKFVPDRSQPRKPQPKPHLSHAYKQQ